MKFISCLLILRYVTNFGLLTDNICDNALDMANGILNVEDNWPDRTYCQWLISAQDENGYVTLEFENFNVRNTIAFEKIFNYSYLSKIF